MKEKINNYFKEALKKYNNDLFNEAMEIYNKILELDKNCKEAYYNQGIIYYRLGELEKNKKSKIEKYEQALLFYDEALKLDKNYKVALNNQGIIYYRLGKLEKDKGLKIEKYEQALVCIDKALELDQEYILGYKNKIIIIKSIFKENKNLAIYKELEEIYDKLFKHDKEKIKLEYGLYLLERIKQVQNKDEEKRLVEKIIDKKLYFSLKVLSKLKLKDEGLKNKLKKDFILNLKKENIGKEEIEDKIYYMCKEINKYTIETLVNKGVYKNKATNFNDPLDPIFKKSEVLLKEEFNKIRITCFSEEWDNILLWSHYGKNHKGMCLGYKLDKEKIEEDEKVYFGKIRYEELKAEEELLIEDMDIEDESEIRTDITFGEAFLRKKEEWQYENEYRLLHLDIEDSSEYFKKLRLQEVIFGMDTAESDKKLIYDIVTKIYDEEKIKFFEIILKGKFKLSKKEYRGGKQ